jgi:hypothetical protein
MANDSSTGGYLPPQPPLPLNDTDLQHFLHDVIVGITNLSNDLVRPAWQQNPPPLPPINTDWCAFSITTETADNEPAQVQISDLLTEMRTNELINLLCTFYGNNAQYFSTALRDGIYMSQNREPLLLAGMGLVGVNDIIHAPELINDRYYNRYDLTIVIRREMKRQFPILTFLKAEGTISADNGAIIERDFTTN